MRLVQEMLCLSIRGDSVVLLRSFNTRTVISWRNLFSNPDTPTLLERFWRISLYDAIVKLCVTKSLVKLRENCGKFSHKELSISLIR